MKHLFKTFHFLFLTGILFSFSFYSCNKDEAKDVEDPIASYQFAINETNPLEVTFSNFSQNATSYSWEFGDGETSTEESPVHTYTDYGAYTVTLTASNSADVTHQYSETLEITDPDAALKLLTGETTKTWKLYREGVSMSLGPDETNPAGWWAGLQNDGARPCLYNQTFTFGIDGSFVFDDGGEFWGEFGVFDDTELFEICFPAEASNMVNKDGVDVSAWLSGTYTFEYEPATGVLTLNGEGAWIGIPKLGPAGESSVPLSSTSCTIEITEETGYDLMTVAFDYGEAGYWQIIYASYSDPTLEPDLVTVEAPWGEDLEDITPSSLGVTFASRDAADLNGLDTIASGSTVEFGVDDPTDASAAKVGQFNRTGEQYQELQFRTIPTNDPKDILFDNLSTVSVEVYIPSSNDYSGTLTKGIVMGFGDISETKDGWWNDLLQFEVTPEEVTLDTWSTFSFDLTDAKERTDLDMFYIGIGGSGHTDTGTFYIRNLKFE